jgi:hypothetical protein
MLLSLCRGLLFFIGQWSFLSGLNTRRKAMKAGSIIGLLFAAAIFATAPISPQVTSRGLAVNVDTAQAITYGHARRVNRRMDRRDFRQTRRAVRRGVY